VTGVAVGDASIGGNVVKSDQGEAERILVRDWMIRRGELGADVVVEDILHVEDLLAGAKIFLGTAVAIEAPAHAQVGVLEHEGHLIDLAVAGDAADAFVHVDVVGKIDEIGEIVDARPVEGDFIAPALAHGLQDGGIGPDAGVAGHAGFGGGETGEGGIGDGGVAIAAIDAEFADVMLVAEGDGLIAHDALVSDVGRTFDQPAEDGEGDQRQNTGADDHLGDGVHAGVEDL